MLTEEQINNVQQRFLKLRDGQLAGSLPDLFFLCEDALELLQEVRLRRVEMEVMHREISMLRSENANLVETIARCWGGTAD